MSVTVDAYPLGRSDAETRRLMLQHQVYSPITRQFLMTAGITRGMKVLDLGSGAGDVAMLCADLVGPQGAVVGIDANASILDSRDTASERWDAATSSSGTGTCGTSIFRTTSTRSSAVGS